MADEQIIRGLGALLYFLLHAAVIIRAILREHRSPAARIAWVVVIIVLPGLGILAYLLLGETSIGRKRVARMKLNLAQMPPVAAIAGINAAHYQPEIEDRYAPLFHMGHSVNGFDPIGGNRAQLLADSNATIEAMVADIDHATAHVHLLFYIWLSDNNGLKIVAALKRAAGRGVVCRAMADGLGSRAMITSEHWKALGDAGVKVAVALPIGNPLLRPFRGRIDLRNHRKILIIDNSITYCGSQNCADPEFRVKAKYAPWVDAMMRFEGPIVRQNQALFASDWLEMVDDNLDEILQAPLPPGQAGFTAQVIGTGPTVRSSAMPEVFETLIYAAREELVISTPYYVPDEAMQAALCASARRGVKTTIIFPARNDSFIVGAASRSYYEELLYAGVQIHEYEGGLLHTKSLTLDGKITLIGSANMDRRSFELNYENNILCCDESLTTAMYQRQQSYLAHSRVITLEMVAAWPAHIRFYNNALAMFGPVL